MAYNVADIVYRVIESFQALNQVQALGLINDIHKELSADLRLYPDVQLDLVLVAGTGEYTLPDDLSRIWAVHYIDSITTLGQPLKAVSVDTLDYEIPTWRTATTARPYMYYERAGKIGLYPSPSTSSSGGVPTARIYYAPVSLVDLDIGDDLPTSVKSIDAWVYGACYKHALQIGDARLRAFEAEYQRALSKALGWSYGRVPRDKPSIRFSTPGITRY